MKHSALLLAYALIVLFSCAPTTTPVTQSQEIYDTVVSLTLYSPASDDVFQKVFDRQKQIDAEMSLQKTGSEIQRINAAAGSAPVAVSSDTFFVLKTALEVSKLTHGLFDPSIGPVTTLWNVTSDHPKVPSEQEILKAKALVGYQNVVLDEKLQTVFLKNPGMMLDFGGIAKGFAVDEAARIVKENGVTSGVLSMGQSTVMLMGSKPEGKPWKVGVKNPFAQTGEDSLLGVIETSASVVETSGPYERFFMENGKRYHHIMDPRTGAPAESDLSQVTLILPIDTKLGDGLSSSTLIMGSVQGKEFLDSLKVVGYVLVTNEKNIIMNEIAKNRFRLQDKSFSIVKE